MPTYPVERAEEAPQCANVLELAPLPDQREVVLEGGGALAAHKLAQRLQLELAQPVQGLLGPHRVPARDANVEQAFESDQMFHEHLAGAREGPLQVGFQLRVVLERGKVHLHDLVQLVGVLAHMGARGKRRGLDDGVRVPFDAADDVAGRQSD